MAIVMNNSANITYNFAGQSDAAVSNIAATSLTEDYSLQAEKVSQNSSWRPSENLTYIIKVQNGGTMPIYAVSVQDNLGGSPNSLLTLVPGSVKLIQNESITDITPTSTAPLTVVLPDVLDVGETVMLTYMAKVKSDIASNIEEIVNVATVAGHKESAAGAVITADPSPTITLSKADYAEVKIVKSVDKDVVSAGEKLTYAFRIENSGNTEATQVVVRDNLPAKFKVDSIKAETNGVTTTFETTDYSIDTNNRLVLPTSVTKTISVPAATATGYGVTIVTIEGTVEA